jgi:hypothetical protein
VFFQTLRRRAIAECVNETKRPSNLLSIDGSSGANCARREWDAGFF